MITFEGVRVTIENPSAFVIEVTADGVMIREWEIADPDPEPELEPAPTTVAPILGRPEEVLDMARAGIDPVTRLSGRVPWMRKQGSTARPGCGSTARSGHGSGAATARETAACLVIPAAIRSWACCRVTGLLWLTTWAAAAVRR
jgi:hypothetical protein